MTMATRVDPVIAGSRPELAKIEESILAQRGGISPLYQVLLNSAPLAEGWEKLLTALRNRSCLPADLREMVILRVAILNRAPFEFEAHRPLAVKAGVSADKLAALREIPAGAALDATERAVMALADAMTREVQVSDALFEPLRTRFDARALTELVALVAAYNMVSRFLEAMNIGH
jgi:4-carboxymuconolactone decarboxylase